MNREELITFVLYAGLLLSLWTLVLWIEVLDPAPKRGHLVSFPPLVVDVVPLSDARMERGE